MKILVSFQLAHRSFLFKNTEVFGQTETGAEQYKDLMNATHVELGEMMSEYATEPPELGTPNFDAIQKKQVTPLIDAGPGSPHSVDVYGQLHNFKSVYRNDGSMNDRDYKNYVKNTVEQNKATMKNQFQILQNMLKEKPPYTHLVAEGANVSDPNKLNQLVNSNIIAFRQSSSAAQEVTASAIINGQVDYTMLETAAQNIGPEFINFSAVALYKMLNKDVKLVTEGNKAEVADNVSYHKRGEKDGHMNYQRDVVRRDGNVSNQVQRIMCQPVDKPYKVGVIMGSKHLFNQDQLNMFKNDDDKNMQPVVKRIQFPRENAINDWAQFENLHTTFTAMIQRGSAHYGRPLTQDEITQTIDEVLPQDQQMDVVLMLANQPSLKQHVPKMYDGVIALWNQKFGLTK